MIYVFAQIDSDSYSCCSVVSVTSVFKQNASYKQAGYKWR